MWEAGLIQRIKRKQLGSDRTSGKIVQGSKSKLCTGRLCGLYKGWVQGCNLLAYCPRVTIFCARVEFIVEAYIHKICARITDDRVYAIVELCKQMVVSPLLRRKLIRTSVKVSPKTCLKHEEIHQQRAIPVN